MPAIGFALGPIVGVVALFVAWARFPDVAAAGYGGIYALELLVQAGLLAFLIYAATQFFGKKSTAPSVIITLLEVSLGASIVLFIIEWAAEAEVFAMLTRKQLVRSVIAAAIWIPYFTVSKRVKATFVRGDADVESTRDDEQPTPPADIDGYIAATYTEPYGWACKCLQRGQMPDHVAESLHRKFALGPKLAALIVHAAVEHASDAVGTTLASDSDRMPDRPTWEEVEAERRAQRRGPRS